MPSKIQSADSKTAASTVQLAAVVVHIDKKGSCGEQLFVENSCGLVENSCLQRTADNSLVLENCRVVTAAERERDNCGKTAQEKQLWRDGRGMTAVHCAEAIMGMQLWGDSCGEKADEGQLWRDSC